LVDYGVPVSLFQDPFNLAVHNHDALLKGLNHYPLEHGEKPAPQAAAPAAISPALAKVLSEPTLECDHVPSALLSP